MLLLFFSFSILLNETSSTSLILDAMDQAEEQYQRNLQSHLEIIDRLLRIYGARLREQKYRYENELKELLGTSNNDTDQINYNQTEDEIKLQSMIFNTNQHLQELAINFESSTIGILILLNDASNVNIFNNILKYKKFANCFTWFCRQTSHYFWARFKYTLPVRIIPVSENLEYFAMK